MSNFKKCKEDEIQPEMILSIDIGNEQLEQLYIYNIYDTEKEVYDFCLKNGLNFFKLKEIKEQIQEIIKEKNLLESDRKDYSEKEKITNEYKFNENIYNSDIINPNDNYKQLDNITNHCLNKSKTEDISNDINNFNKFLNTTNTNNKNNFCPLSIENNNFINIQPKNSEKILVNSGNDNNKFSPDIGQNKNIALRNYFSNENDNYFLENNNIKNNDEKGQNKKSTSVGNTNCKKYYNPGQNLYERNLRYKEIEKERLQLLKKNLELDEEEDITFSPKINKISENQKIIRKQKKLEYSNPEIITNFKKYKEEKYNYLKLKEEKELLKNCTFKPKINHSSSTSKNNILLNGGNDKEIVNKNTNNKNNKKLINGNKKVTRFEKLYNDRLDKNKNQNQLSKKFYGALLFKPQLNDNSSFLNKELNKPFNERLQTYSNKAKQNFEKLQQILEKEYFNNTFKPRLNNEKNKKILKFKDEKFFNEILEGNNQIKKDKKLRKNNSALSIDYYTKLYLYNLKYKEDKNMLTEQYYNSQNKTPKFCKSSEEIMNKKLNQVFIKIFKILDSEENNQISNNHMCIHKLPKKIQKILNPVFLIIKENKETLNEKEFVFVLKNLYQSLPYIDKKEFDNFVSLSKNKKNKKIRKRNNKSLINIINDNKNSLYGRFAITVAGIGKSKVKNCTGISENNISCGSSKNKNNLIKSKAQMKYNNKNRNEIYSGKLFGLIEKNKINCANIDMRK